MESKLKLSPQTIGQLRNSLASPVLLGADARTASDDQITAYVEGMMRGAAKLLPGLKEMAQRMREGWSRVAVAAADFQVAWCRGELQNAEQHFDAEARRKLTRVWRNELKAAERRRERISKAVS